MLNTATYVNHMQLRSKTHRPRESTISMLRLQCSRSDEEPRGANGLKPESLNDKILLFILNTRLKLQTKDEVSLAIQRLWDQQYTKRLRAHMRRRNPNIQLATTRLQLPNFISFLGLVSISWHSPLIQQSLVARMLFVFLSGVDLSFSHCKGSLSGPYYVEG